jgi:N-acetylmuramoyl-L-alanine amidase
LRSRTVELCVAAVLVCALHCTAQAAGADPWGAEVAKPEGAAGTAEPTQKARQKPAAEPKAQLTLTGDRSATIARLRLRGAVGVRVFTLASPYRVIVELTGASLPPPKPGSAGHGLVERYHSGQFEAGKSRVVMETIGPTKATEFPVVEENGFKIAEIALTPMPVAEFGEGTGANPPPPPTEPAGGLSAGGMPPDFGAGLPGIAQPPARPVIVIDPGHGGIDPGAVGADNLYEKAIVMAVALKLEDVLEKSERYQVRMTREADVFVALDQRVAFSRQNAANLFISLHADSLEQTSAAQSISGATVYTLSERASDEQARKMAEKENASDLLAGLSAKQTDDDDVKNILIDLMKRETATFSAEFANVVRTSLGKSVQLSRDPMRSAAFKVLKQTHAPSVLIELGYMSNAADAKRLNSPDWQLKIATAIANAVDAYFASRSARAK